MRNAVLWARPSRFASCNLRTGRQGPERPSPWNADATPSDQAKASGRTRTGAIILPAAGRPCGCGWSRPSDRAGGATHLYARRPPPTRRRDADPCPWTRRIDRNEAKPDLQSTKSHACGMETERIWRPSCLWKQADRPFPTRLAIIREKCRFAVRSTVSTIKCYTGANIKYPNSVIILMLSGGHRPSPKRKKETVYDERQLPRHRVRHHPAGRTTDWSQAALNQLDKAYGYKSFRPGQLEAVNAILNRRDLIAVMPTGSGKSVCYQLPALRVGSFTVVVSPLRALMRDQMQALQARSAGRAHR